MIDKLFLMFKELRRELYNKNLRTAYKEWLEAKSIENDSTLLSMIDSMSEDEFFEASDKARINDDKLINKLFRESFRGLTEEEVESYKKDSDLFREFMETEGFNYRHKKGPKYITYKAKNYSTSDGKLDINKTMKKADNKELDNAVIDFIYNTLTSYEGSSLMMRQGTYRDVKKSSRIERILHNKGALQAFVNKYGIDNIYENLNKLSVDDLNNTYEAHATPRSPMDIMYWADLHRNLMDGNDLIGMLAVSSSSHYKLQFLEEKLVLKNDYVIRLNGNTLYKLDMVYSPIDPSKRIGELCAQLQAASPDNGKDPCLGDMNINPETVDLACLLVRLGVSLTDVGMILNSQDVLDFQPDAEDKVAIDPAVYVDNFNLDTDKLAEMKTYITLGQKDKVDMAFIANYRKWYSNLKKVAKDMTAMNPVLRSDSPNGAMKSDFAEAIRQKLILEKLEKETLTDGDFAIDGFQELIDFNIDGSNLSRDELFDKFEDSIIARLQAVFSLGFTSAFPIVQQRLSDFSNASITRLREFMSATGMDLTRAKYSTVVKQLLNEFTVFLLTRNSIFGNEEGSSLLDKRNYYIHDFPIKFNAILTLKDDSKHYVYENIIKLPAIQRLSNRSDKGIKMDNIGKISPETRKWYTEAFDQLLNMGDNVDEEERRVAKELAVDLLMYAFFDNGMTFRYNSFSNFFSSLYMKAIPGLVDAYREADNLARSESRFDNRFISQFLLNHPKYIPKLRGKDVKRKNNYIYPIKNDDGYYPNNVYIKDKSEYREFITLGYQGNVTVFRRVDDLSGNDELIYEKVEMNNTGTLYYDGNTDSSDIDYTKVKPRGNVNVKLDRLLKEKVIKEKTSVPTTSTGKVKWAVTSKNGFEVSTKAKDPDVVGDARFSAFNAKFKSGTVIDGVDVGGKSIEYVYQTIIKKSRKGQPPAKNSRLYNESLKTKEERENFSYYEAYLPLWQEWAEQNPELIEELRKTLGNRELTDGFAGNTTVNQARALADILNSTEPITEPPLVTDNFDDDPYLPTDTNFNDSPIDIVDDGSKEFADVDMSNVSFSDDSYIIVNGGELYGEAADSFLKEAADAADKEEEKKAKSLEEYSKEHNNWC